jgi:hypothetical protein
MVRRFLEQSVFSPSGNFRNFGSLKINSALTIDALIGREEVGA